MAKQTAAEIRSPVVSSAHLASGASPALSEIEFGLIMAGHAFQRWIVRGMAAAGYPDLSPLEVMALHAVNHRDRRKRQADLCLVLNIEDTHLVAYAVKKLERLGLVDSAIIAKEKMIGITPLGAAACLAYRRVREDILVAPIVAMGMDDGKLSDVAARLRALAGQYDQAARAAASL